MSFCGIEEFHSAGRLSPYAVIHGASVLILGFTVFEILFGIIQILPVAGDKKLNLTFNPIRCRRRDVRQHFPAS
jgi:hypothetical protein